MGMLATIMNSVAMQNAFLKVGVEAVALSAIPMQVVTGDFLRDKAIKYLKKGKIVICAGGTGCPYFTTDTAASLRALELDCDVLLKATKVDFVYDKDPVKYKDAKSFKRLSYDEVLSRELQVMDLSAISMCAENHLPIVVFNLKRKGNIKNAVLGNKVGTIIS
jgi:uridylate kinase